MQSAIEKVYSRDRGSIWRDWRSKGKASRSADETYFQQRGMDMYHDTRAIGSAATRNESDFAALKLMTFATHKIGGAFEPDSIRFV